MSTGHKNKGHESKHKKSSRRSQRKTKRNKTEKSSFNFEGESTELKGNVFETFTDSKDTTHFERTMKALQVYVAGNFRHGSDIGWMFKHEKEFQFTRPNPPSSIQPQPQEHRIHWIKIYTKNKLKGSSPENSKI